MWIKIIIKEKCNECLEQIFESSQWTVQKLRKKILLQNWGKEISSIAIGNFIVKLVRADSEKCSRSYNCKVGYKIYFNMPYFFHLMW